MENIIVLIPIIAMLIFAIRSIIRNKKSGKSLQCGGNCNRCSGGCHTKIMF